eukprot:c54595_g1_i1 orf=423-593(+)
MANLIPVLITIFISPCVTTAYTACICGYALWIQQMHHKANQSIMAHDALDLVMTVA